MECPIHNHAAGQALARSPVRLIMFTKILKGATKNFSCLVFFFVPYGVQFIYGFFRTSFEAMTTSMNLANTAKYDWIPSLPVLPPWWVL